MVYSEISCNDQDDLLHAQIWQARNFTGQVGERALKSIVKDHAE